MAAANNKVMELIRKFGIVIGIVAVVLILVIFRSSGNNFRPDAEKWAEPSYSGENIITPANLPEPGSSILVITLDENNGFQIPDAGHVTIPASSILEKQNLKKIKKHGGPVLLASADPALSAGIWMMLSQMGMKNIFIFSENDDELLKNEFRPDTLVLPEL